MSDGPSTAPRLARCVTACTCLAAICLALTLAIPRASAQPTIPYPPLADPQLTLSEAPLQSLTAGALPLPRPRTRYVDGVSDQSLAQWSGSFANLFRDTWIDGPFAHITFARYVVQWNVMSGAYPAYLAELQSWYADVLGLGLIPDLALTSYDGVLPASTGEYRANLTQLLDRFPGIRYLEAWNEPNDTPGLPASTAAAYTGSAYTLCLSHDCTAIAGDLLDSPDMTSYERAYVQALPPVSLLDWGIHPYYALAARNPSTVLAFEAGLPGAGVDEQIWFTEVGAYLCSDYGRLEQLGERAQAIGASWLVNRLMPAVEPAHVFYYELAFAHDRPPPCDSSSADTALYAPSGDPNAPEAPRAAAAYIYDDRGIPSVFTGRADPTAAERATLTAGIYPGGFLDAAYHFEYGPTAAYGSYSSATAAGSSLGRVQAAIAVSGLRADTTYHYRVVAWNAEGATYGSDRTFTTPPAPR